MSWFIACRELVTVLQGIIQFHFSGKFTKSAPKLYHYLIYLLIYELCSLAGLVTYLPLFSTLLNILALYGTMRLLLKNEPFTSAVTAVLTVSIMQISYGLLHSLFYIFAPYIDSKQLLALSEPIGIVTGLLSLILGYFFCWFTARYFSLEKASDSPYLFMTLLPVLFFFMLGFYIINSVYGNTVTIPFSAEWEKSFELLLMQLLGFCAILSSLYACQKLCDSFRMKSRLALLEQETHAQKTYVSEAKARYELTKAFRHDIRNHLSVLNGLLKAKQTEQAKLYLEKLGAAVGELSFPVQTGNPVVDILVNSKLELAARKEIEADISLILPKSCTVDELDLCVIFSNALDNAIAACLPLTDSKIIRIRGEQQGDFYLLEFENNCRTDLPHEIKAGTGLSNIKTVAEKYCGAVTIEHYPGHFCLNILLNIHDADIS